MPEVGEARLLTGCNTMQWDETPDAWEKLFSCNAVVVVVVFFFFQFKPKKDENQKANKQKT